MAILHCVLAYPTTYTNANLEIIKILKRKFKSHIIGYSDHTLPDENSLVLYEAYKAGAQIIEKHFTLDHNYSDFRDHKLSANPEEMKELVQKIEN